MDRSNNSIQANFAEIVKKAYERGLKEDEVTVLKLIEELKADLKQLVIS